jgi:hypothetical protein
MRRLCLSYAGVTSLNARLTDACPAFLIQSKQIGPPLISGERQEALKGRRSSYLSNTAQQCNRSSNRMWKKKRTRASRAEPGFQAR